MTLVDAGLRCIVIFLACELSCRRSVTKGGMNY